MARKLICDRCSEEINPSKSAKRVLFGSAFDLDGKTYDLCVSCAFWLNKFLKDEIRIERKENETD